MSMRSKLRIKWSYIQNDTVSSAYLEDLEAGDIQHADEILPLVLGVQSLVAAHHQPGEHTRVDGFWQGSDGVDDLQTPTPSTISTFRSPSILHAVTVTLLPRFIAPNAGQDPGSRPRGEVWGFEPSPNCHKGRQWNSHRTDEKLSGIPFECTHSSAKTKLVIGDKMRQYFWYRLISDSELRLTKQL